VFEIVGVGMVVVSLIGLLVLGIITALRVRRIAASVARLRTHPMLDAEWLGRKGAILMSLSADAQRMRDGLTALKAAFDAIARGLGDLTVAVFATAAGVEDIMDSAAPWLRGLFALRGEGR